MLGTCSSSVFPVGCACLGPRQVYSGEPRQNMSADFPSLVSLYLSQKIQLWLLNFRSYKIEQCFHNTVFTMKLSFIVIFQDKLTYEFTECDSAEGRWRVAVPKDPGSCEASEVPVRQKDCSKCSSFPQKVSFNIFCWKSKSYLVRLLFLLLVKLVENSRAIWGHTVISFAQIYIKLESKYIRADF